METTIKGNPMPYPVHGTDAAKTAWVKIDEQLLREGAKTPAATAVNKSDAIVGDGGLSYLDYLPGTDDEKQSFLQRRGVELVRGGATNDDPELLKVNLKFLQISEAAKDRYIDELETKISDGEMARNHADRQRIDAWADKFRDWVHDHL